MIIGIALFIVLLVWFVRIIIAEMIEAEIFLYKTQKYEIAAEKAAARKAIAEKLAAENASEIQHLRKLLSDEQHNCECIREQIINKLRDGVLDPYAQFSMSNYLKPQRDN